MRIPVSLAAAVALLGLVQPTPARAQAQSPAQSQAQSPAQSPAEVLTHAERVADYQIANPYNRPTDWLAGAMYAGMWAFAEVSNDAETLAYLRATAEGNGWALGPRPYFGDDHCVGQLYAEFYTAQREPRMLAPTLERFNDILSRSQDRDLLWVNSVHLEEWAWCDALFMAPPTMTRLSRATGDPRYTERMLDLWDKTTRYLYDPAERLYYRDSRFFDRREPNGEKVFWSRGNGWVFAGLARVLQDLPLDHPRRPEMQSLFSDMAARLLDLQRPDGYWRSSLLDPASTNVPETSGTGFFCFGLAWGVNAGLLEEAVYMPAVDRAWAALVAAIQPDGRIGWVQQVSDRPETSTANNTTPYGTGAFLLAASEVYKHRLLDDRPRRAFEIANPALAPSLGYTARIPIDSVRGLGPNLVAIDRPSGDVRPLAPTDSDGDGTPDTLTFRTDLLPGERKIIEIVSAAEAFHGVLQPGGVNTEPTLAPVGRFEPATIDTGKPVVTLQANAGWCWFQDERAVVLDGTLVFGSVAGRDGRGIEPGDVTVTAVNLDTLDTRQFTLHRRFQADDHNAPAFLPLAGGRLLATYAAHGGTPENGNASTVYWAVTEPNDPLAWQPTQELKPTGGTVGYANLATDAEGRVLNFIRAAFPGEGWDWHYLVSADNAETFAYGGRLMIWPRPTNDPKFTGRDGGRPYPRFANAPNGDIHLVTTEDHPRAYQNGIYHALIRGGIVHHTGGEPIAPLSTTREATIKPNDLTPVFVGGETAGTAWTSSIELDPQGRPVVGFIVRTSENGDDYVHRYHYAAFDGQRWSQQPIAHAGDYFYNTERDYTGLIAIDPNDTSTVYISTNEHPITGEPLISAADGKKHWEIFRGVTPDRGETWRWTAITKNSTADNIRPIVPQHNTDRTVVLWLRGDYRTYRDYDLDAVAYIE